MSKKLSKFSAATPTPESSPEDLKVDFKIERNLQKNPNTPEIIIHNVAASLEAPEVAGIDYVSIALEKIRAVAHDASAEISARVAAVEVLHARGETGLEEVLVSCLARKATNGAEIQVRAAKTLLEIAEKK